MTKKSTKIASIVAVLGAIGAGGLALNFDFSQTTTTTTETNIGGNTVINNYISDNFGVDVNVFREMCLNDEVPEEARVYCRLIGG